MKDSSRNQGLAICAARSGSASCSGSACSSGAWWAVAIPGGALLAFVLGLTFWVGYTLATVAVEPEADASAPQPPAAQAAPAPGEGAAPATTRAHLSHERLMRIALLTYRGNMYCGGQGIYAAYLAREWQRAGHEVHVIAGPPLPDLAPGIALAHASRTPTCSACRSRDWAKRNDPRALLTPDQPVGARRLALGVFPEMQSFGLRLFLRWRELQRAAPLRRGVRQPEPQLGPARPAATGVPVVSVIHHPLHLDREADFAIDPRLLKRVRRTLYFPLFMQQVVAKRLDSHRDRERGVAPRDRALLRHPREGGGGRLQRHRHASASARTPRSRSRPT